MLDNISSNDYMCQEVVHRSKNNDHNVSAGPETNETVKIAGNPPQNIEIKDSKEDATNACYEQDANSQARVYIFH